MTQLHLAVGAAAKFNDAYVAQRSLLFYTLSALVPILVIAGILLFTRMGGRSLIAIVIAGAAVSIVGFGRLLYELMLDIAGFPDYKLPVWAVAYLIEFSVMAFAFTFLGLHLSGQQSFEGFGSQPKTAFVDSLYLSLSNYIGVPPDPSISLKSRLPRLLSVGQGVLSLFINLVVITKFVNAF